MVPGSVVRHAYRHVVNGLIGADEDEWYAALDIALRHDVRPVAVDVFEALAATAAIDASRRRHCACSAPLV